MADGEADIGAVAMYLSPSAGSLGTLSWGVSQAKQPHKICWIRIEFFAYLYLYVQLVGAVEGKRASVYGRRGCDAG